MLPRGLNPTLSRKGRLLRESELKRRLIHLDAAKLSAALEPLERGISLARSMAPFASLLWKGRPNSGSED